MLKPSRTDQANAFLKFFQANFWFNVILFVQDVLVADGFYESIKKKSSDPKWDVQGKIISESLSNSELSALATSMLGTGPKIVIIHADLKLTKRIFRAINEANLTVINHAWFATETSFTRDHDLLDDFPSGTLSIIPSYVVNIEDVILDGTNFMIKSVIHNSDTKTVLRSCWNDSNKLYKSVGSKMYR